MNSVSNTKCYKIRHSHTSNTTAEISLLKFWLRQLFSRSRRTVGSDFKTGKTFRPLKKRFFFHQQILKKVLIWVTYSIWKLRLNRKKSVKPSLHGYHIVSTIGWNIWSSLGHDLIYVYRFVRRVTIDTIQYSSEQCWQSLGETIWNHLNI